MSGGARLAMRPEGLAGRLFGKVVEAMNAPSYRLAIQMIDPAPHEHVLEVGFGTGRLAELLIERLPRGRVAGVDPTETMVEVARERPGIRRAGDRVDLRCGDASRLPWPDASFDAVAALHCFQFWPDPEAGLREARRVLRPNGRLALILREHGTSPPAWLPNPISRSPDEIAGTEACLLAAGFRPRAFDPIRRTAILATAS